MAIDFEATSSQWANIGLDKTLLRNIGAWTIMAWVKIESLVAAPIVSVAIGPPPGTSQTSRGGLEITAAGAITVLSRRLDADASIALTSGNVLAVATRYHLAGTCVYGANRDLKIFQNASQIASSSTASTASNTSDTNSKCAAIAAQDDGVSSFFDGIIEDVRIYTRALSAAEIETIYASEGVDGIVDGLQARWYMREGGAGATATGASTVRDLSNNGLHATPTASPLYADSLIRGPRRKVL